MRTGVLLGLGLCTVLGAGCSGACEDDGLFQDVASDCASVDDSTTDGTAGSTGINVEPSTTDPETEGGVGDGSGETGEGETDADTEPDATCGNGVQDGDETDVDCGGPNCEPCEDGESCSDDTDCVSGLCDEDSETCVPTPCSDGVQNGDETGVDCGGPTCDACPGGEGCASDDDCASGVCDPESNSCSDPTCDDGVQNGDETDIDCGGDVCDGCDTGEMCDDGDDCSSGGCPDGVCNPPLNVEIEPTACADAADGGAVTFTATASGGTGGPYTYAWTPDDGTVSNPDLATTDITPTDYSSYTVTVDDGVSTATAVGVVVISTTPFNLEENCTLYQGDLLAAAPAASITYLDGGTVAVEGGNNDLGLHLCEGVSYSDTRLTGSFAVNTAGDDDLAGVVWGAQDNSNFYIMAWKQNAQNDADFEAECDAGVISQGVTIKRVFAPSFEALTSADLYCANDTANSELLVAPEDGIAAGWADNTEYRMEVDFQSTGTTVRVTEALTDTLVGEIPVADTTWTEGFYGSHTLSQAAVSVGPLFGSCL